MEKLATPDSHVLVVNFPKETVEDQDVDFDDVDVDGKVAEAPAPAGPSAQAAPNTANPAVNPAANSSANNTANNPPNAANPVAHRTPIGSGSAAPTTAASFSPATSSSASALSTAGSAILNGYLQLAPGSAQTHDDWLHVFARMMPRSDVLTRELPLDTRTAFQKACNDRIAMWVSSGTLNEKEWAGESNGGGKYRPSYSRLARCLVKHPTALEEMVESFNAHGMRFPQSFLRTLERDEPRSLKLFQSVLSSEIAKAMAGGTLPAGRFLARPNPPSAASGMKKKKLRAKKVRPSPTRRVVRDKPTIAPPPVPVEEEEEEEEDEDDYEGSVTQSPASSSRKKRNSRQGMQIQRKRVKVILRNMEAWQMEVEKAMHDELASTVQKHGGEVEDAEAAIRLNNLEDSLKATYLAMKEKIREQALWYFR